jgi:hypothetical protein
MRKGVPRRVLLAVAAPLVATALWLPALRVLFRPAPAEYTAATGVSRRGQAIAARQMQLLAEQARSERASMRRVNAEWDFMGRTYLVLSLANLALREPARKAEYLGVLDGLIDQTLRDETTGGMYYFLMPYAHARPWVQEPPRSLFVDGEIALMLAARRMLGERADYRDEVRRRLAVIEARMNASPVLCAESYPDECWLFCNTIALAAMRLTDVRDGSDHGPFFRRWTETARAKLMNRRTGMLVSSFTFRGRSGDGPEGSSIWMAAHMLQIIDPQLAADQYARARRELGCSVLGFGYAHEWPASGSRGQDVDSGPVIPLLDVSAGSSGLALVGAAAFGDTDFLRQLHTTLDFAAFPMRTDGKLRYAASNQVGDAVLLYSLVLGPLWDLARPDAISTTLPVSRPAGVYP